VGSISRRRFLQSSAALASVGALAACGSSGGGKTASGDAGPLSWWDHFGPLQPLQKKTFAKFAKAKGGVQVDYTWRNASKMGQALQLAKQSNQLPDVTSLAGLNIPVPALIKAGWLQPLELNSAATDRLKGALINGVHIFDGSVYNFPIFSPRQYSAANWFNIDLLKKADVDPDAPPGTYDEFRSAATAIQKQGKGTYGWIWNVGMPDRMGSQVDDMAQAAGFEGGGGVLYRTGEYAYHSDPYVNVIEFLVSLQKDKLLFPGSTSFSDKIARARWVTGVAGFYFDGPWCPGAALQDSKDFATSLGVGPMLVPEKGTPVTGYRGVSGGPFFITKTAKNTEAANLLLSDFFTVEDYYIGVANAMDQPPRDLDAVAKSSAHKAYKKLIKMFDGQVFHAPVAVVRNADITKVLAETQTITPALGDIVQGALTGDVTDIRGSLKTLSDKSTAAREKAIKAATAKGAKVSMDDYVFSDWKPRTDYQQ
jgi:multiple sugar transport system substrate-binding protein